MGFESPESQHILSLQNWLKGNGCVAREETQFLEHSGDLFTLSLPNDGVISWLEEFVSSSLVFFGRVCVSTETKILPKRE